VIYLYWYLGIGVVVLAVVYGAHHMTKGKESESIRDLLEAVNPDRKKLSYRILNNFVAPVLAAIAVVAVWPVAVFMKAKELFQKKESYVSPEEREFVVEREHLLERLTVQEIERREVVADPLKAAPELPLATSTQRGRTSSRGTPMELNCGRSRHGGRRPGGAKSCGVDTSCSMTECRAPTF